MPREPAPMCKCLSSRHISYLVMFHWPKLITCQAQNQCGAMNTRGWFIGEPKVTVYHNLGRGNKNFAKFRLIISLIVWINSWQKKVFLKSIQIEKVRMILSYRAMLWIFCLLYNSNEKYCRNAKIWGHSILDQIFFRGENNIQVLIH